MELERMELEIGHWKRLGKIARISEECESVHEDLLKSDSKSLKTFKKF